MPCAATLGNSESGPDGMRRSSLRLRRDGGATRRQGEAARAPGCPGHGRGVGESQPRTAYSRPRLPASFRQELRSVGSARRAAHAFDALIQHAEGAWPEMVRHLDDGRYSITFEAGSTSGYAYNWTVGDVCRKIIVASLTGGYLGDLSHLDKVSYYRLHDFVPDKKQLRAWCEQRSTKRLYELQIDVCQWAVAELEKGGFERVPASRRLEWIAAAKSEIKRLKASKEAFRFTGFGESVLLYRGNAGK